MAQQTLPQTTAGGSLVVGGCGFLGYHIVQHLLRDAAFSPVHVLDIEITKNLVDGVTYTQGGITDKDDMNAILQRHRPRIVFHMASPLASLPSSRHKEFFETNVEGTQVLLDASKTAGVKAFVYTSTVDVYAGPPHSSLGEDAPLWTDVPKKSAKMSEYCRTKAIADGIVRLANSPSFQTVVLRPGHVYGERHTQGLYEMLEAAKGAKPLVQLRTDALMEVASADNVAAGHVLAAKALLAGDGRVAGEAFNLSDGAPVPFWHHVRVIWTVARGKEAVKNVWTLSPWVMKSVVAVAELLFWALSLGKATPPTELTSASLSYCVEDHSYSTSKAQQLLGFAPVANHDEVLAESVRWELRRRGQPVMG
ncbi:erg26, C-3 sterol dehydrogenase [Sporothrix eucalyptigena]|uniref:Erg26, C-3 sterol dehydrogenase n=1 Tax=Sporothrix eucalyptigena TaxID=1812306 RepID=A0ABP0C3D1_9PEZI